MKKRVSSVSNFCVAVSGALMLVALSVGGSYMLLASLKPVQLGCYNVNQKKLSEPARFFGTIEVVEVKEHSMLFMAPKSGLGNVLLSEDLSLLDDYIHITCPKDFDYAKKLHL